ncbi:MAG: hypothetical protein ACOX0A_03890 [Thermoguttaceae bacterium]
MKNEKNHEVLKSIVIGLVALAALFCWLEFQPRLPNQKPKEKIGKKLFEHFDDPAKMTKIEFAGIDPETGNLRQLDLIRDGQQWRLPAMSGFPAENSDRLAKVVAPLMQLTVLDVVDETTKTADLHKIAAFHRECGLVHPMNYDVDLDLNQKSSETDAESENMAKGAALQVKIEGEGGDELLDLLIGGRAPESSATRDDRFIRLPNEEVVYTADFIGDSTQGIGATEFTEFPDRVSFKPIDWVDRDLLRISRWDILYLAARDYSFSIVKSENEIKTENYQSEGVALFKQDPTNSSSRLWSLETRFEQNAEGIWRENKDVEPESANNDALNETADVLGKLNIVDVRKKPATLAALFHASNLGAQLATHAETLSEFGFALTDVDPLDLSRIEPSLIGEGGAVEITTKNGVKIAVLFGKKFEDMRVVLAYASYSRDALAANADDEAEVVFLEPEAKQKASLKNERFADWFYLIEESDYEKLHFRLSESLK